MEGETISVGPWGLEEGTPFSLKNDGRLQKVVLIYEGAFKSLFVKYSTSSITECMNSNELKKNQQEILVEGPKNSNIIKNGDFSKGIDCWRRRSDNCQAEVVSSPGGDYAIVARRKEFWDSIEQDISGEVCVGTLYDVSAHVSVKGGEGKKFQMSATVKIENLDGSLSYLHVGRYL